MVHFPAASRGPLLAHGSHLAATAAMSAHHPSLTLTRSALGPGPQMTASRLDADGDKRPVADDQDVTAEWLLPPRADVCSLNATRPQGARYRCAGRYDDGPLAFSLGSLCDTGRIRIAWRHHHRDAWRARSSHA